MADFKQARQGFFETLQQIVASQAAQSAKPVKFAKASSSCTPCAARAKVAQAKAKYTGK